MLSSWKRIFCLVSGVLSSAMLVATTSYANVTDDLHVSGYLRVVAGQLNTDLADFKGYSDSISFKPNSLLALQAQYEITDTLSLTSQFVARSSETDDSGLEWLYLTWNPVDDVTVRAGRQRGPFFLYSDSIDIGYAYPWVNLPYQIYSGYIFPTFDGIDVIWDISTESVDYSIEAYAGSYGGGDINVFGSTTNYELDAVGGLILKARYDNNEVRLSRYRGSPQLDVPEVASFATTLRSLGFERSADALKTGGWGSITQVAFARDTLDYFVKAEWMTTESDIEYMVPVLRAFFVGGGIYDDNFTYHLRFSRSRTKYSQFEPEIVPGIDPGLDQLYFGMEQIFSVLTRDNLDSWTAGVRWDVSPGVALKAEATLLQGNAGEEAFFESIQPGFDREATLYLIGLDWVF